MSTCNRTPDVDRLKRIINIVGPYVDDIDGYLSTLEKKSIISEDILKNQSEINESMRAILIDWLVSVHRCFRLVPDTLYLCVHILDKYLSVRSVSRADFQLLGVTALMLAMKYEEEYDNPYHVYLDLIADNNYVQMDLLECEHNVLVALDYDLSTASPMYFLRKIIYNSNIAIDKDTLRMYFLSRYLCESSLLGLSMRTYSPSEIAAASVYLARIMIYKERWRMVELLFTPHDEKDIRNISIDLNSLMNRINHGKLRSIKTKFRHSKRHYVSMIPLVNLNDY